MACTVGSHVLKNIFGTCRQTMVRLDGKKSHLRKEQLQAACNETAIPFLKPLYPGKTRFGSQEKTAQRCIDLKPAIFAINDIEVSAGIRGDDVDEDNEIPNSHTSWADIKRELNNGFPILEHILPIFKEIEQWTQIISSNRNPSLSKCRLACRRLSQHVDELQQLIDSMQPGKLKSDFADAIDGLEMARSHHLGHDYYMFPSIRVAEFLDVEVFHTIPPSEWKDLRGDGSEEKPGLIANFLLEKDTISPAEIARRVSASTAPRGGGGRRQRVLAHTLVLTEEEQALLELNDGLSLSEVNPLHEEIKSYITAARAVPVELRNTLGFWKENELRYTLLARVARRVLSTSGTSCDVERLFSRAGLICTALRNRLSPKTIQCLTSLHCYYASEEKVQQSTRSKNADGRAQRFASLTTDLLIQAADSYISESDSDGDF